MALCMYIQQHHKDGPFFIAHTVAATTAYKDIYPKFLALESQGPEQLATSFWQDFDKAGCKVLRGRPMMVTVRRARHGLQSRVPLVAFAVLAQLISLPLVVIAKRQEHSP
jgi:hypothetical protein